MSIKIKYKSKFKTMDQEFLRNSIFKYLFSLKVLGLPYNTFNYEKNQNSQGIGLGLSISQ